MSKKTRVIILLVCVACFFVGVAVLVPYSMGYRFDFEKMKITATGGIYVRTFPSADQIVIDSKTIVRPGMFSNSVFVQSLLPNNHIVLAEKSGYYSYSKTISVEENQVTKIENIILFKTDIQFTPVPETVQSPFDGKVTPPAIKKLKAFASQGNNIIWLGTDGFLYKSDSTNLTAVPTQLTLTALKITTTGLYKITADNNNIFVNNNGNLLFLNTKTYELDAFASLVKDATISPDGKNIAYFNDKNIYISSLIDTEAKDILLYKTTGKITDCLWLNSNYIIFTDNNKIIISETDSRGNINTVVLPKQAFDEIYFSQQEGKIYILSGEVLLSSEKITP